MFEHQAIRMLRTKWKSTQALAEELFAIFRSGKVEHEGGAEFTVPPGSQFIIRGGDNTPGSVGPIGDIRLDDVQDIYQFGPGGEFPPFQPYPWPGIDFPQFNQPSVVIETPVIFQGPVYYQYPPVQLPGPQPPTEPESPELPEEPEQEPPPDGELPEESEEEPPPEAPGETPSNLKTVMARIVSGTGQDHVADIYDDGPDAGATEEGAPVKIMNLDASESIDPDTWLQVTGHYVEDDEEWLYYAVVPVWME